MLNTNRRFCFIKHNILSRTFWARRVLSVKPDKCIEWDHDYQSQIKTFMPFMRCLNRQTYTENPPIIGIISSPIKSICVDVAKCPMFPDVRAMDTAIDTCHTFCKEVIHDHGLEPFDRVIIDLRGDRLHLNRDLNGIMNACMSITPWSARVLCFRSPSMDWNDVRNVHREIYRSTSRMPNILRGVYEFWCDGSWRQVDLLSPWASLPRFPKKVRH
jgi:hypothetical protein